MPYDSWTINTNADPSPCLYCSGERSAVCHGGCKRYKIYKLVKMLEKAKVRKRRAARENFERMVQKSPV